jgi:hypothetical protein
MMYVYHLVCARRSFIPISRSRSRHLQEFSSSRPAGMIKIIICRNGLPEGSRSVEKTPLSFFLRKVFDRDKEVRTE